MFTIDGMEWEVPCKIERTAELKESEISGMLLNKNYLNDCLGTWMRYDISIAVPFGMEDIYTQIYEYLTAPVNGHAFTLPYNQGEINIVGRVESVKDTFYKLNGGKQYWYGTQFTVIANHPSKTMTLEEVIAYGTPAFPRDISASIGDTYTYTANGWVQVFYDDADEISY